MKNIDDCILHQCATTLQAVRIEAAGRRGLKNSPYYVQTRRKRFPNSDDVVAARGAWRASSTLAVAVCAECCAARDSFLKQEYPRWSMLHCLAS